MAIQMSCGYSKWHPFSSHRLTIEGGHFANQGDIPYVAALIANTVHMSGRCGAVFISRRHLISATHCFFTYSTVSLPCQDPKVFDDLPGQKMAYGGVCLMEGMDGCEKADVKFGKIRKVVALTDFHKAHCIKGNDFTIVELEEDVVFDKNTQPACLFSIINNEHFSERLNGMKDFYSSGWGKDKTGTFSRRLKYLHSKFRNNFDITSDTIDLTAVNNPKDRICNGDSGNGLFAFDPKIGRDVVIGLHSYSNGCDMASMHFSSDYSVTSTAHHIQDMCDLTGVCPPGVRPSLDL
ncbi:unnamed protein product [Bursaphelenchus okinawaensis]|uniref:Peptidase S1 domain-containing protein n=1 Tax=Bursaphelenchus okinawaensis TaxID=465554 RepID=A0A811K5U0_9BILA|nr:unnamed protein product [Bursaphelenchus okinawaensis]CAG9091909.1 unnamed protein product [Bursaphelenchus okinawaensis]